ncbi:MAG: ECF transporter S component [Bacillota bacterium]|jgi:niacin transporter
MNTKNLTIIGLLTALSIVIPFAVFFKVIIPPFSATISSHVPMFVAMFFGPKAAIMVGLGSGLGFFLTLGPLVGARALMHIIVGMIGARMLKNGYSFGIVALVTAPIHGLLEVMVIMPFVDFNAYNLFIITGVGTMLHHGVDAFIAKVIVNILEKPKLINMSHLKS